MCLPLSRNLGVKTSFLGPADIATGDLSKFDVLLLGVRTYAVREDLRTYNSRILDYVKNGGVAIVQYNTPEFDHNYGPYPYSMTSNPEEVTDEASKVEILAPSNPLFNWPNKITEKDFGGWVEERGSKWMKSWDPQYQALIETHDEGQEPQKGGLLYAKYGKGIYMLQCPGFLSPVAGRRPRRVPHFRQHDQPGEESTTLILLCSAHTVG